MTEIERRSADEVFGERASYYSTSRAHTDQAVLSRVVELAQPQPSWKALDVGTGTGHTAFALAPHVAQVVGQDLTEAMLDEARALQHKNGLAVCWDIGDVHALPYEDGVFDLVVCRRAAHHFTDVGLAVSEMVRVLRVGGRLVIDDRSVPEDDAVDRAMNLMDAWHDHSHVRQYRPSEWREMLGETGISVDAVEPYVRHRPIAAMLHGASAEDEREVRKLLADADEGLRNKLNLVHTNGILFFNHWYLLVAGEKR